jgi:hypothetical protein
MDRAKPSFAALIPIFHDPFPPAGGAGRKKTWRLALRAVWRAIFPLAVGASEKANAPTRRGKMVFPGRGGKDREKRHEQL